MKYPFRSQAYQPRADVYLPNHVNGSTQITRYGCHLAEAAQYQAPADAGRNGGVSLMNPACRVSRRACWPAWPPHPARLARRCRLSRVAGVLPGLACLCLCG
jgi:hypothetical protein